MPDARSWSGLLYLSHVHGLGHAGNGLTCCFADRIAGSCAPRRAHGVAPMAHVRRLNQRVERRTLP